MPFSLISRSCLILAVLACQTIASAQLAASPWPKQFGDIQNRSLGTFSGTLPVLKWHQFENVDPSNPDFTCSPIIIGQSGRLFGKLYSQDPSVPESVFSIDPATGSGIFLGDLGVPGAMTSKHTILTSGIGSYDDQTGANKWTSAIAIAGSPSTDANGMIYGGQSGANPELCCLTSTGQAVWLNSQISTGVAPPAIGPDHNIYSSGGNQVLCADGATGESQFWVAVDGNLTVSPAVLNNSLLYFVASDGNVYCHNAGTGALVWSYHSGSPNNSAFPPVIDSAGNVIVYSSSSSTPGYLYALKGGTGILLWQTNQSAQTVVATSAGSLLCLDNDGTLSSVDSSTGKFNWHCQAGDGSLALGSQGALYVTGTYSPSGLYAFDSFSNASLTVPTSAGTGGTTMQGTVSLPGVALGRVTVALHSQNPSYVTVPTSVTFDAGTSSKTFPIVMKAYSSNYSANVSATFDGVSKSALVNVQNDKIANFVINPSTVTGGATANLIVTLASPAPPAGWRVTFTSQQNQLGTLVVPAGATSATFAFVTNTVSSDTTISITCSDFTTSKSANLTITGNKLQAVSVNPTSVIGGASATGTVSLGSAASTNTTITLSSNNSSQVTIPTTVVIPSGSISANFTIATKASYATKSTILTASDGTTSKTTTFTILGDAVQKLVLNPASVTGGSSSTATVTLTSPAPAGGWSITLSSGNPNYVGVPASTIVPAGATTATFTVTTKPYMRSYSTSVNASDATSKASATITVNP